MTEKEKQELLEENTKVLKEHRLVLAGKKKEEKLVKKEDDRNT